MAEAFATVAAKTYLSEEVITYSNYSAKFSNIKWIGPATLEKIGQIIIGAENVSNFVKNKMWQLKHNKNKPKQQQQQTQKKIKQITKKRQTTDNVSSLPKPDTKKIKTIHKIKYVQPLTKEEKKINKFKQMVIFGVFFCMSYVTQFRNPN